jgi:hypothetical protein
MFEKVSALITPSTKPMSQRQERTQPDVYASDSLLQIDEDAHEEDQEEGNVPESAA